MPRSSLVLAAGLLLALAAPPLAAQQYPSRPIRVVVPYPAGGVIDVVSRTMTERLAPVMGQPVVVENRPGGHTVIATELVLGSAPDGHTWFIAPPAFATNVALLPLRYDPLRDFLPVARFALSADIFVVPATLGVKDVAEYVRLVKAKPGAHNFGIPGIGGAAHIAFEQFKRAAALDLTGIPYQGAPPIIPDLINNQLSSAFLPGVVSVPQVKAGKINALAVIAQKRQATLPDVPTIAEAGYPAVQATLWIGVVVPAKTPREVQRRAAADIQTAVASPETQARLGSVGAEAAYLGPEAFEAFIRQEIETSAKVVKDAGIKVQ